MARLSRSGRTQSCSQLTSIASRGDSQTPVHNLAGDHPLSSDPEVPEPAVVAHHNPKQAILYDGYPMKFEQDVCSTLNRHTLAHAGAQWQSPTFIPAACTKPSSTEAILESPTQEPSTLWPELDPTAAWLDVHLLPTNISPLVSPAEIYESLVPVSVPSRQAVEPISIPLTTQQLETANLAIAVGILESFFPICYNEACYYSIQDFRRKAAYPYLPFEVRLRIEEAIVKRKRLFWRVFDRETRWKSNWDRLKKKGYAIRSSKDVWHDEAMLAAEHGQGVGGDGGDVGMNEEADLAIVSCRVTRQAGALERTGGALQAGEVAEDGLAKQIDTGHRVFSISDVRLDWVDWEEAEQTYRAMVGTFGGQRSVGEW